MKNTSVWECQKCGAQSPKWAGRCPECGAWGSLVEEISEGRGKKEEGRRKKQTDAKPKKLSEILKTADTTQQRISTGIGELDRVLGKGMVPGAVMLLAGEPGMGKSTLLSQVGLAIARGTLHEARSQLAPRAIRHELPAILYICGEESPSQVAMRLRRLSASSALISRVAASDCLSLFSETNVDVVTTQIEQMKPDLVIIDSIQTMFTNDLSGMAGAVGQIRECAGRLSQIAKAVNIPLFLVGHVTKEGDVAGPKVLEHVVDVVLVMEGQRSGALRMVRAAKNRFGPVDEVGLFAMEEGGMREVKNPAELLIGEHAGNAPGSVLGCVLEGQRPLVLEIQALVVPSKIAVPRRVGQGINERRLQLLCAVIEKHLGLGIGEKDVFVNVAGGLRSQDPGLDLAVVAAIVSSCTPRHSERVLESRNPASKASAIYNASLDPSTPRRLVAQDDSKRVIFCGEVGLLGEVRMVAGWERREKEVGRLKVGRLIGKNEIRSIGELREYF